MTTVAARKQTIPGPRALPLLGWRANLLPLYRHSFTYLRWLHDRYGDVVALAQGDPSYVFAFGPALNLRLLANPDLFEVSAGPLHRLSKDTALGRLLFPTVQLMNGAHHKQQRRLMQPAFHKKQLACYHDDMVTLTERMLDDWQTRSEIDLLRTLQQLTQRIAVKTLFGLSDETELDRIGVLLRRLVTLSPLLMIAPINVPGMPYSRALRLAEQLEAYIRSMITHKRDGRDATDVLATLVHVHDEDGAQLSDDELIGNAFTLFVAGHETTSNALTWTIFLLGQYPRLCADLLDELDSTLHGTAPTLEQLNHLPLLDSVIKESLRLLPPASIGLRSTAAPCELGGFALPKGATIFYSEFVTHRLPELYVEPDRFKPERWATLDRSAYEYLPFSAGPHMCIGAGFAMQEMKVVLATLLQRYRLSVVTGARIEVNIRMNPTHGMPMRIFPQDRQFERVPVRGSIHRLIDLAP